MSAQLALNVRLRDGASFENFQPGPNREPLARLEAVCAALVAGAPAPERVLYLWGPAGSGRSHLLQAACRALHDGGCAPFYLSLAETAGLVPAVLEGAERAALVCLDDCEAIAGSPGWERALFALCERLRAAGGVLLAAGAAAPAALGLALPDLASRLGWGPVYQLATLDEAGRLAAIQLRARNRGLELGEDVVRYILARYPRDMASLFALLERLDRASLASRRRVTIPFLRELEGEPPGVDGVR
jgi:DnaA family protein